MQRRMIALIAASVGAVLIWQGAGRADAQATAFANAGEAREALNLARSQQRAARGRGERLEQQAAQSGEAAEKSLQQAAALAARIQQAEAGVAAAEASLAIVDTQSAALARRLAERREPLVRLTGALQSMARRPMTLSALQPGSLKDLVYTQAVLESTIPQIHARTANLRNDLDQARALQNQRRETVAEMRASERTLAERRRNLVALAANQRASANRASGDATREAERALALGEQARDLDTLVGELEQAGELRGQLAALPGPMLRPAQPERAVASSPATRPSPAATAPPGRYQLPVAGRVVAGFGEAAQGAPRQSGIALAPRGNAQVVAPGAGRVAFAGPYRGYGHIVIIEHANGWTSLVTGLDRLDTSVGARVTGGSPLGLAAPRAPQITLELRQGGTPRNPIDYLR